jgi:hypothetical protein
MTLNTIWKRRAETHSVNAVVFDMKTYIVEHHWLVFEWTDIGEFVHQDEPPSPACKLAEQGVHTIQRYKVPLFYDGSIAISCEACRIMYEECERT